MTAGKTVADLSFPHTWQAEVLLARPLILPPRHFIYPRDAEEIEHGALEVQVRPNSTAPPFLATCALGFRDPAVPTGVWACPNPAEICAVSGGYAYIIDTGAPENFTMILFRPVLDVRAVRAIDTVSGGLLLFVGHHAVLAWGVEGEMWRSAKLSDEGVTITAIEEGVLHGLGWHMMTDKETPFALDLRTGNVR